MKTETEKARPGAATLEQATGTITACDASLHCSSRTHFSTSSGAFQEQIDLFREIRERVSARSAAEYYGLTVDHYGRALCPFHNDTHPSMTFKGSRFRCWACNASGDAVDLVARLYGLTPLEAARRLDSDFHLCLELDRPLTHEERVQAQKRQELHDTWELFENWRLDTVKQLNAVFREAHLALLKGTPLTDAEAEAVHWQATAEYFADALTSGTMAEQMTIFRQRREVMAKCQAILRNLNSTPKKLRAS